jgi:predicted RNase H-like HicB family nuclease
LERPATRYHHVNMSGSTTMHLTAAIVLEDGWYVARCLEVEVASQGVSVEEALANLREALELYFEDAPPVTGPHPIVAPIDVQIPA